MTRERDLELVEARVPVGAPTRRIDGPRDRRRSRPAPTEDRIKGRAALRAVANGPRRHSTELDRATDDRLNEELTRLLREAAEIREGRERSRETEDALLARSEASAFIEMSRGHDRPQPHASTPGAARHAVKRHPPQAVEAGR